MSTTETTSGISIIIPLYNKSQTIARAIDSVLRQSVPCEIVVVDDGSTDGSDSVVKKYGGAVRYCRQANSGPSAARNFGASLSSFPVLGFLDADDELLPGCLAAHLECRRTRPEVKLTISPLRSLQSRISHRRKEFVPCGRFHYSDRFIHDGVTGIHISTVCIDRDLFDKVGGFDVELWCWEIYDFMFRAALAARVTGFLDKSYVAIHKDPSNSQFQREKDTLRFRERRSHKILDRLGEVPREEQKWVLRSLKATVKEFVARGARKEARDLAQRLLGAKPGSPQALMCYLLSLLPEPVIRGVAMARRGSLPDMRRP